MVIDIEAIDILQQHDDIFSITNNLIVYMLRFFWYILSLMQLIVTSLENALNEIFKHLNFFNSTKMLSFMQNIKPITSALLVIGILIIGYKVMTNTLKEKRGLLLNFIIIVVIFSGFQTLLVQFSNLTTTSANAFMNIGGSNVSQNIIKNSIIDLKYLDENNFSDSSIRQKNNINPNTIMKIDPVELMKPKETNNKQVFENRLVIDTAGNISTKKLGDGYWGFIGSDIFSEYYYRYKIEWINLTVVLFFMILGLAWSCIQVAQFIFQLGVTIAITPFVATIDVSSGQRTKRVLQKILNLFLVIISVAFMYRMFYLGIDFIQSIRDLPVLVETILIVGFSLGLIKGPDIIQELLGIDVGTSASNLFYTSQMMGSATKTALNTPKNIGKALGNGAKALGGASSKTAKKLAGATGYANGRFKGLNELKDKKNNDNKLNNKNQSNDNKNNLDNSNQNDSKGNDNIYSNQNTVSNSDNNAGSLHQNDSKANDNISSSQNTESNSDNNAGSLHQNDSKANDNISSSQNTESNSDNNAGSLHQNDSKANDNISSSQNIESNSDNNASSLHQNDSKANDNISSHKNIESNSSANISNKPTQQKDTTTTLNDVVKQRFYNSTFGKNIKEIKNTYNTAKQIGQNTAKQKQEKSIKKRADKHNESNSNRN